MRIKLVGMMQILLVAILCASAAGRAQAQNYPWCAYYSGADGGGTNCGFTSFDQCMDTVRGMGGFCNVNTQYVAPPGSASSAGRGRARQPSRGRS